MEIRTERAPQRRIDRNTVQRHIDVSLQRMEGEGVWENSTQLLPAERLLLTTIIFASKHHKLHHTHTIIGREISEYRNAPILVDNPAIDEGLINNAKFSVGGDVVHFALHPELIALSKATKSFGRDLEGRYQGDEKYLQELSEYSRLLWWVGKKEESASQRPSYPRNLAGRHFPSIAQDIMTYRNEDGVLVPMHQRKELTSNTDQFAYLESFFNLDPDSVNKNNPVHLVVRDGVAIHDLLSDVAFVAQREEKFTYDCMTPELLQGYFYGAESLENESPEQQAILAVWKLFDATERKLLFGDWTPELGVNTLQTVKINGAIPNQNPILWLARTDLRELLLSGKKDQALDKVRNVIDIVSGRATHLPQMLRAMIQLSASRERLRTKLGSKDSELLREVATATNKVYGKRVLPGTVIDLSDYLETIRIDQEYVSKTIPGLLRTRN